MSQLTAKQTCFPNHLQMLLVVAIAVVVVVSWLFTFHLQHELPGEKPIASVGVVYRKCKQGSNDGAEKCAIRIGYIRRIGGIYNR